uniref:Uncharacterized protein n=1 Tax=Sphaerodactylus townsendi TaxID=933632 RepID=A0ACB8G2R5_9SAUR
MEFRLDVYCPEKQKEAKQQAEQQGDYFTPIAKGNAGKFLLRFAYQAKTTERSETKEAKEGGGGEAAAAAIRAGESDTGPQKEAKKKQQQQLPQKGDDYFTPVAETTQEEDTTTQHSSNFSMDR